eukprot:52804-Eustigmatos_ZCMA.PRE.1
MHMNGRHSSRRLMLHDQVSPAGPKRVVRRWGYGIYVICAAALAWFLYTGWKETTKHFQLSNTRVEGYKCTMLRGYS